jgi:hypothetical protein
VIGSSCQIYKTCRICGQTKWFKKFETKGRGQRKTYCKQCKKRKGELKSSSSSSQYTFDTYILKKSDIEVRLRLPTKKRIQYTVSYEQAVVMVEEGMAGIVHETLIHKLYDKQTFRDMVLNRDNYQCCYCGEYGDTIDHIIPKSKGGLSTFNNVICSCIKCNTIKDDLTLEEFLYYVEPISNQLLNKAKPINSKCDSTNEVTALVEGIEQLECNLNEIKKNLEEVQV